MSVARVYQNGLEGSQLLVDAVGRLAGNRVEKAPSKGVSISRSFVWNTPILWASNASGLTNSAWNRIAWPSEIPTDAQAVLLLCNALQDSTGSMSIRVGPDDWAHRIIAVPGTGAADPAHGFIVTRYGNPVELFPDNMPSDWDLYVTGWVL